MKRLQFEKREIIFRQGEYSTDVYRIIEGEVDVFSEGDDDKAVLLASLQPGDIFGEMAMIDDSPRSATVMVTERLEAEVISPEDFNTMYLQSPTELAPYLSCLIERLRSTNETLRDLMLKQAPKESQAQDATATPVAAKTPPRTGGIRDSVPLFLTAQTPRAQRTLSMPRLAIKKFPFRIGRASLAKALDLLQANDLGLHSVDPSQVSRNHLLIGRQEEDYYIQDRNSLKGCEVNGVRIGQMYEDSHAFLEEGMNQVVLGEPGSELCYNIEVRG